MVTFGSTSKVDLIKDKFRLLAHNIASQTANIRAFDCLHSMSCIAAGINRFDCIYREATKLQVALRDLESQYPLVAQRNIFLLARIKDEVSEFNKQYHC